MKTSSVFARISFFADSDSCQFETKELKGLIWLSPKLYKYFGYVKYSKKYSYILAAQQLENSGLRPGLCVVTTSMLHFSQLTCAVQLRCAELAVRMRRGRAALRTRSAQYPVPRADRVVVCGRDAASIHCGDAQANGCARPLSPQRQRRGAAAAAERGCFLAGQVWSMPMAKADGLGLDCSEHADGEGRRPLD